MCQEVVVMEKIKHGGKIENKRWIIHIGYSQLSWGVISWAETWKKWQSNSGKYLGVFCYLQLKTSLACTSKIFLVMHKNRTHISLLLGSFPGPTTPQITPFLFTGTSLYLDTYCCTLCAQSYLLIQQITSLSPACMPSEGHSWFLVLTILPLCPLYLLHSRPHILQVIID